jgi:hypothetical protein
MIDQTRSSEGVVVQDFATDDEASNAIRALQARGFSDNQISVLAARLQEVGGPEDIDTEAQEGAAIGAVGVGALTAVAAAIAGASAIVIPGIGIAIGGWLAAAIMGAVGGGVAGALVGAGIPEDQASAYQEQLDAGRILVAVQAGPRMTEARQILDDASAETFGPDNIYNPGTDSTGNAILDESIGTTMGVTPPIDTLIGEPEGEGYSHPEAESSARAERPTGA